MRALTIWQPRASLIACGATRYETRSWSTDYRGPVAIHAAAKWSRAIYDTLFDEHIHANLIRREVAPADAFHTPTGTRGLPRPLPLGAFVGVGNLVACLPTEDVVDNLTDEERHFGDFSPGRFAWGFAADVKRLDTPMPATGQEGLWFVPSRLVYGVLPPAPADLSFRGAAPEPYQPRETFHRSQMKAGN